jgi:CBS domain-containing protein
MQFARRLPRCFRLSVRGTHSKADGWTLAAGNNIKTMPITSTVKETCKMMQENQVGAVMVLDDNYIAGIFTDRDVVQFAASQGNAEEPVSDYMTSFEKLITATTQSNVKDMMVMILKHNIRHIPMVDREKKQMLHMISIKDVVNTSIQELNQEVNDLRWFMEM